MKACTRKDMVFEWQGLNDQMFGAVHQISVYNRHLQYCVFSSNVQKHIVISTVVLDRMWILAQIL